MNHYHDKYDDDTTSPIPAIYALSNLEVYEIIQQQQQQNEHQQQRLLLCPNNTKDGMKLLYTGKKKHTKTKKRYKQQDYIQNAVLQYIEHSISYQHFHTVQNTIPVQQRFRRNHDQNNNMDSNSCRQNIVTPVTNMNTSTTHTFPSTNVTNNSHNHMNISSTDTNPTTNTINVNNSNNNTTTNIQLTDYEIIQLINLVPKEIVELYTIIECIQERLSLEQQEYILQSIQEVNANKAKI